MDRATYERIYRRQIEPASCPGGVVIRICAADKCLVERKLAPDQDVLADFDEDSALAIAALKNNEDVFLYFYDGDSGECMGTVITQAPVNTEDLLQEWFKARADANWGINNLQGRKN